MSAAFVMAVLAAAQAEEEGEGPTDPPSSLSTYTYGGGLLVGLQWVNGDTSADTQILQDSVVIDTVAGGVTSYNTGTSVVESHSWCVQHIKNEQTSGQVCV